MMVNNWYNDIRISHDEDVYKKNSVTDLKNDVNGHT